MLLDTNVIVFAASPQQPQYRAVEQFLLTMRGPYYVAAICRVELLGYHQATPADLALREHIYEKLGELPVVRPVLDLAADLRRQRQKLKVVDAVVAATAILNGMPLVTNNVGDFDWIEGLEVLDPLGVSRA